MPPPPPLPFDARSEEKTADSMWSYRGPSDVSTGLEVGCMLSMKGNLPPFVLLWPGEIGQVSEVLPTRSLSSAYLG